MADGPPFSDPVADAVKRAKEIAAKMLPASSLNGSEDSNSRKRPLDEIGHIGDDGPMVKKPTIDSSVSQLQANAITIPTMGMTDPQLIAQAAIAKVGAQLGLTQMITIDIKVPNRMVGLVIGRQGEMINRLQAESGARIQVAPDGSEVAGERQVTICGTPETVEKAKALVNKVVEDAGGATSMPVNLEPGQEVVELMIPANKVGLVIGKGGEMIKALQERAGCKMQMIQDGQFANAPEKPLRMTGLPESCKKARELVVQLIEQKELEVGPQARGMTGDFTRGMPQTVEVHVPKPLVGFVIGRNGEHINNIQNTCGVRLQFQNDVPGTEYRVATIAGPPEACQRAKKMVEDIVAERGVQDFNAVAYPSQQMGGFKPRIELPNPTGPGVQTVQFPVPAGKCGLVIGKGGDTIRQLQVQSGTHIELHRGPQPNPHEKLFNVRGNPQQIQHAQQLIRQKCDMMGGPGGFPGQQMPGMPYQPGQMYNPQQAAYAGAQAAATPWAQYPYQQAYGAAAQQQAADPSHQAAWAAYYQQLYAAQAQAQAQAQAGQQAAATQQGQGQPGQPSGDLQSQWAEYYRQLGYAYYGGQPGGGGGGAGAGGQQQPGASSGGGGGGGGPMASGGSGGPEPK